MVQNAFPVYIGDFIDHIQPFLQYREEQGSGGNNDALMIQQGDVTHASGNRIDRSLKFDLHDVFQLLRVLGQSVQR